MVSVWRCAPDFQRVRHHLPQGWLTYEALRRVVSSLTSSATAVKGSGSVCAVKRAAKRRARWVAVATLALLRRMVAGHQCGNPRGWLKKGTPP